MKLQEESNPHIWYVLQKIKRHYLHNQKDFLSYDIHLLYDNNREFETLKKLSEWNVINIIRRNLKQRLYASVYYWVNKPKFDEIYRKFNPVSDPETTKNYTRQQPFSRCYIEHEIKRFELVLKHLKIAREYLDFGLSYKRPNKHYLKKYYKSKNKKHKTAERWNLPAAQIPLPITGKIEVSGLEEGLKVLRQKSPEYSGPKFPFKIPAGTHWNNVIIKFLDDERIEIWVKRLNHVTDYKEMGMVGKGKIPTPSEQWIFLKVLAQCRGELTIRDSDAKDTYKKQKQALTETLQRYFSIDYDPFYPYKSGPEKRGNSYKIKIILLPPPEIEKDIIHIEEIDKDTLGIREYLNEEAPQVPDY